MGALAVSLECRPRQERVGPGEPVLVDIELRNDSDEALTLLPMSVPWLYHHAIRFEVLEGPPLDRLRWVLDPPEEPDTPLAPHASVSGQVDLARYLGRDGGEIRLSDVPGRYVIRGVVNVVTLDPVEPEATSQAEVPSNDFTIVVDD